MENSAEDTLCALDSKEIVYRRAGFEIQPEEASAYLRVWSNQSPPLPLPSCAAEQQSFQQNLHPCLSPCQTPTRTLVCPASRRLIATRKPITPVPLVIKILPGFSSKVNLPKPGMMSAKALLVLFMKLIVSQICKLKKSPLDV